MKNKNQIISDFIILKYHKCPFHEIFRFFAINDLYDLRIFFYDLRIYK
jgi:hypothetical protein